jgi:hypothetical protein
VICQLIPDIPLTMGHCPSSVKELSWHKGRCAENEKF